MFEDWGPDDPRYQSRVLGQFPKQSEHALISLEWLENAMQPAKDPGGLVDVGIDVARPGEDETVMYFVCGSAILDMKVFPQADPRGECIAALRPWHGRLGYLSIDGESMGHYFVQHFKDHGYKVNNVRVGLAPNTRERDAKERYANLKAQLYSSLRDRFKAGEISRLDDRTTLAQLASIQYEQNSRGQTVIESKREGSGAWHQLARPGRGVDAGLLPAGLGFGGCLGGGGLV